MTHTELLIRLLERQQPDILPPPLHYIVTRPVAPMQKVAPAPIIVKKKKRATALQEEQRHRRQRKGLTSTERHILQRTRLAMDFGRRIISMKETVDFVSGVDTSTRTWESLLGRGFVRQTRSFPFVSLTAKGEKELNRGV